VKRAVLLLAVFVVLALAAVVATGWSALDLPAPTSTRSTP